MPENLISCRFCAMDAFRKLYKRHFWFPLVREPLVLGMRILSLANGIRPREYAKGHPECGGCVRFMKEELMLRSGTFRLLNRMVGPWFRRLRDSRLTEEDFRRAKEKASEMSGRPGEEVPLE